MDGPHAAVYESRINMVESLLGFRVENIRQRLQTRPYLIRLPTTKTKTTNILHRACAGIYLCVGDCGLPLERSLACMQDRCDRVIIKLVGRRNRRDRAIYSGQDFK